MIYCNYWITLSTCAMACLLQVELDDPQTNFEDKKTAWKGKFFDEFVEVYGFGEYLPLGDPEFQVYEYEIKNSKILIAVKNQFWIARIVAAKDIDIDTVIPTKTSIPASDRLLERSVGKSLAQIEKVFGKTKVVHREGLYRLQFADNQYAILVVRGVVVAVDRWNPKNQQFEPFAKKANQQKSGAETNGAKRKR